MEKVTAYKGMDGRLYENIQACVEADLAHFLYSIPTLDRTVIDQEVIEIIVVHHKKVTSILSLMSDDGRAEYSPSGGLR